jgi:hypothetical protein
VSRPTLFNEHVARAILADLANGQFRRTAAIRAGIAYSTLRDWLRAGKDAPPDSALGSFWRMVQKAEAEAEWGVHEVVRARALEDARLGLDYLRVRYRKRWSPRQEVTGKGGNPVELKASVTADLSRLTAEELELAIRLAEKARG